MKPASVFRFVASFVSASVLGACAGSNANLPESGKLTDAFSSQSSTVSTVPTPRLVAEYKVPSGNSPQVIVNGPDGNLWFTESNSQYIGRITVSGTATGTIKEFFVPAFPSGITAAPDGNLWFTDPQGRAILRMTPNGAWTRYPLPSKYVCNPLTRRCGTLEYSPTAIAWNPVDGRLWFREWLYNTGFADFGNDVGQITTSGVIHEDPPISGYPCPNVPTPFGMAMGPNGILWMTDVLKPPGYQVCTSEVYGLNSFTNNFYVPIAGATTAGDIAEGPDSKMWVTESDSNSIANFAVGAPVMLFRIPTPSAGPTGIVTGSDNNLWFTENTANKIGRITTAGAITEFPITSLSAPYGITSGPDGNLWFTENAGNKIGKFIP